MAFFKRRNKLNSDEKAIRRGAGAIEWNYSSEHAKNPVVEPVVISTESNRSITETSVLDSPIEENTYYIQRQNNKTGNEVQIKKIVVIVIPMQSEKGWTDKHDGMEYGELHIIVADNIYLAKEKFYKYLRKMKETKVENIIIDTHGGGAGIIYLDNIDADRKIGKNYYGLDQLANFKNQDALVRRNISSLKMIIEKVKDDGNVVFLGCTMAKGKDGVTFMKRVHQFNYKTNTYASEAYNFGSLQDYIDDDSFYHNGAKYRATIGWDISVPLESGEIHHNTKNNGFKLMTARKGIYYDLAKISNHFGNFYINGEFGEFKY